MKEKLPSLSIIIPAYNEETCLPLVLEDIKIALPTLKKYKPEVIVVDNASTDKTNAVARSYTFVKVVEELLERGKGAALRAGFKEAKGDFIIMLDADYSHIAGDIPKFIEKLERGAMLVIGSRHIGGSGEYTLVRAFGNRFLTLTFIALWGVKVTDVLNGYKAFKKQVVKNYIYTSKSYEIELELVARALQEGGPVVEVSSYERARAGGDMKSKALRDGFKFLKAIIRWGIRYRLGILAKNKKNIEKR